MAKKLWEGAMPIYSFPQPFGDRNKRNSNNKHDVTVLPRSASRIYGEEMEEEQGNGVEVGTARKEKDLKEEMERGGAEREGREKREEGRCPPW